tara:strand:+ start:385 stop:525 length:141 start_codon:yes stop_codon:yes gene_type:complete
MPFIAAMAAEWSGSFGWATGESSSPTVLERTAFSIALASYSLFKGS